jgi:hypothetical protein
MYQIKIGQTVGKHYHVKIGCKSFFFITVEGMMWELTEYIKNHEAIDEEYRMVMGNPIAVDEVDRPDQPMQFQPGLEQGFDARCERSEEPKRSVIDKIRSAAKAHAGQDIPNTKRPTRF